MRQSRNGEISLCELIQLVTGVGVGYALNFIINFSVEPSAQSVLHFDLIHISKKLGLVWSALKMYFWKIRLCWKEKKNQNWIPNLKKNAGPLKKSHFFKIIKIMVKIKNFVIFFTNFLIGWIGSKSCNALRCLLNVQQGRKLGSTKPIKILKIHN